MFCLKARLRWASVGSRLDIVRVANDTICLPQQYYWAISVWESSWHMSFSRLKTDVSITRKLISHFSFVSWNILISAFWYLEMTPICQVLFHKYRLSIYLLFCFLIIIWAVSKFDTIVWAVLVSYHWYYFISVFFPGILANRKIWRYGDTRWHG